MGPRRYTKKTAEQKAVVKEEAVKDDKIVNSSDPPLQSLDGVTQRSPSMKAQKVDSDTLSLTSSRSSRPKSILNLSLSRKAVPSTQVARESILGEPSKNGQRTADFSRFEHKRLDAPAALSDDRPAVMKNMGKVQPAVQSVTQEMDDVVNPKSTGDTATRSNNTPEQAPESNSASENTQNQQLEEAQATEAVSSGDVATDLKTLDNAEAVPSTGWLGWLGYSTTSQAPITKEEHIIPTDKANIEEDTTKLPTPVTEDVIQESSTQQATERKTVPQTTDEAATIKIDESAPKPEISNARGGSWFGLWPAAVVPTTAKSLVPPEQDQSESLVPVMDESSPGSVPQPEQDIPTTSQESSKSSSWGFWSKQPTNITKESTSIQKVEGERGELVVDDAKSQNHPIPAHIKHEHTPSTPNKSSKEAESTKSKLDALAAQNETQAFTKDFFTPNSPVTPVTSSTITQPNLLLPSFDKTYTMEETPTMLQQISRLILPTRQAPSKQVHLLQQPPRIKKALAIGIHGLFPAQFLRTVIGQPTGTSIRFANHAATAIQKWTESHGYECEIEKVALEGEGKIADRVDNLWKLLLNWIDHVRSSDFILIACHSQGVPVAMMLIAKLLDFAVVSSAKIGVCAMAGVSLGPFAEYKSNVRSLLGGPAAELFDFANPNSEVSKRYEAALRQALNYGVRITYVGSLDDQLVSLESAIFSPANHPYIYRAVFVDGRVHAPDFVAHLVGFALKLRNLGVSDHGLIRELSTPLAGSLYTGGGHSSLYHEMEIYDLAVTFALETSNVEETDLIIQRTSTSSNNPFQLPWSMRGLLEENLAKTSLVGEVRELLEQFDEWKPVTKGLKDVKYRLEAVRGLL